MQKDLTECELQLAIFIGDLSERCYNAGWMLNLEYVLWNCILSGPQKYGHDIINESDITQLNKLSILANAWIVFDNETGETAIELEQWKKQFQIAITNNKRLISD
ncbi:hypothetical protein SAMN05421827_10196 [Pedobacter terrae]|uniref:Uncharacterized protein n=1 Tax=Pedobacter terrae TaxID=405671 RepID=A0A1G7MTS8_9SPHI|nr:hypothetical protein [Pedobacter terrae]SDF65142.1 hypothetical protein SAMN05421827_10196 [Pedobacter terrae]